jgi:hypothetical protein
MEMDPNPPSFNIQAQVPTTNIGAGYAAGIAQAGQALSDATKGVMDVMQRNQTADQTLQAMYQNKMLSPEAYKSVAGKGLGAKESKLGMYAGQWLAQQAQERELQKIGYTGQTQVATAHGQLLDTINAIQGKYGPGGQLATGVNPQKAIINPQQPPGQQPSQPPAVQPTLTTTGGAALPMPGAVTPQIQQQATQLAGGPLGSGNIYAPGTKLG